MSDYKIAFYIRLSINDKRIESNSIENQRLLLQRYVENMECQNIKILEFVDNGYSGTNFERPAIQELLELVRVYQIDCIIVKDFSRFGRNLLQTGYFLEQVFPLYHVRFISINENYDSDEAKNNTGGISVTLQFLRNEYYSRDLSEKSKSVKYSKMQKGEYISKNCRYGYKKGNNTLEIDEPAANIVKFIFQLALQGNNYTKIAKELYNKKIVTPDIYKKHKRKCKTSEVYNPYIWSLSTIQRILSDEQYIGTYIMRKTVTKELGERSVKREQKDWIKIPNHHKAIIEKDVFEQVQKQFSHLKIESKKERKFILKGKVYCGYCFHTMDRRSYKNPIFLCRHSKVDTTFPCHNLTILEKELEEIVFQMISKQIEIILSGNLSSFNVQTAQKAELQKQKNLYYKKKQILYEQYIKGKMTEERFIKINLELTKELEPIQNKLEEIDFQLQCSQRRNLFQNQIEKIVENNFHSLTQELVDFFIDRINIFKDNRIEIRWKIQNFM
ncbi:MAG TPA: recombinase family protein [Candidatus Coprocola pullicola]|nr:recombinase family protein [Candidatus Coprocola pullicola]